MARETCYLAIDIGASSGRHMLGFVRDGRLTFEELYRFENGAKREGNHLVWDVDALLAGVTAGLARCAEKGLRPESVAIDTWGVDYVLLDSRGEALRPVYCYRDSRTDAVLQSVAARIDDAVLYKTTGIQKQSFNTLYQLFCDRESGRLSRARQFLMLPDYLAYRLTGSVRHEYTNATTTGLVNANTGDWDVDVLDALGLPAALLGEISPPGAEVGTFLPEVRRAVGFDSRVVLCASHDTASAVAACPLGADDAFLSSGTWSLLGRETAAPILTEAARKANFTNEGGVERRFRFLKNITGMWILQRIRAESGEKMSYDEMSRLAQSGSCPGVFDPAHPDFQAPADMLQTVRRHLGGKDLPLCDLLAGVYRSLANAYRAALTELEAASGLPVSALCIVGGGSRDAYLNRLTAALTGKPVRVGSSEATAAGNLLAQVMAARHLSLQQARKLLPPAE